MENVRLTLSADFIRMSVEATGLNVSRQIDTVMISVIRAFSITSLNVFARIKPTVIGKMTAKLSESQEFKEIDRVFVSAMVEAGVDARLACKLKLKNN